MNFPRDSSFREKMSRKRKDFLKILNIFNLDDHGRARADFLQVFVIIALAGVDNLSGVRWQVQFGIGKIVQNQDFLRKVFIFISPVKTLEIGGVPFIGRDGVSVPQRWESFSQLD